MTDPTTDHNPLTDKELDAYHRQEYLRMLETEYGNLMAERHYIEPSEWEINRERFAGEAILDDWGDDIYDEPSNTDADDNLADDVLPVTLQGNSIRKLCSAQNAVGGRCMNPISDTTGRCAAGHKPIRSSQTYPMPDNDEPF